MADSRAQTLRGLVRERLDPLRPPGYRRIAAAMLVTNIGNGMQFIANCLLVLQMTDSPRAVALVLLTAAIPGVFFGPLIGVAIDRFERRWVFVCADLVSVLTLATTVTLQATGHLRTWHVFVMVFVLGLTESTAVPTGTTMVREIVPVQKLLAANATTGVAVQIGNVIGTAVGGFLIAASSVTWVLGINLVSFTASALFVSGVRSTRTITKDGGDGWRETVRRAAAGFTYLRTHPATLPSYTMLLVLFAVLYMMNTLVAPYAENVLEVGASGLGFIDAMFAVGAILGGLALPLLTARFNRDRLACYGLIGMGLTLILLWQADGLAQPMVFYALAGINFQAFYIFRTRVQEQVPVDIQGRVMALLITTVGICRMGVYIVLAAFVSTLTLRLIYLCCGLGVLILGIVMTTSTIVRRVESRPPENEPELAPAGTGR
ncbi:MFS transporter [Kitasatospora sp. NPDC048540]|uniref:MFS transporter n=1 Tax=unclassified Kitasatospora TaxID=2633591 RepID=UPI00053ABACD|nr:MFS transporter [Kitasatospora sp. MBT63]